MRAVRWVRPRQLEIVTAEEPLAHPGWTVVKPAYAGICGTDLQIWEGRHPRAREGIIVGHEFVARATGHDGDLRNVFVNPLLPCERCPTCREGRLHACDGLELLGVDRPGGLSEQVAVPASSLVDLPDGLSLSAAVLTEPLSVAVRAVRQAGPLFGRHTHVVGAGPIGVLIALCARLAGAARVTISEKAEGRRARAEELGLESVPVTVPVRADTVFEATGQPAAITSLLGWVRTAGRIVFVGMTVSPTTVDIRELTLREVTATGSRNYSPSDVAVALDLLASGRIETTSLVTSRVAMNDVPDAVANLSRGDELKVVVSICQ